MGEYHLLGPLKMIFSHKLASRNVVLDSLEILTSNLNRSEYYA